MRFPLVLVPALENSVEGALLRGKLFDSDFTTAPNISNHSWGSAGSTMTATIAICDDLLTLHVDQVAVPRVVLVDEVPIDGHTEFISVRVQYDGVPVPVSDDSVAL